MVVNAVRISEQPVDHAEALLGSESAPASRGSRSVERALQILVLVSRADGPLRFSAIQRSTGIAKGTLHGILLSLEAARFLQSTSEGFAVGLAAFEVGTAVPVLRSARANADAALDELFARTHETIHFGTLVDGDVLYLSRRDATYDLRSASRIGDRKPAYGTALGKAMLALLDDAAVEALYPPELRALTPNTVTRRDELISQLHSCRERGFASESEESTVGVRCLGMAVEAAGQLFGLSLTVPVHRMSESELERLEPLIRAAARDLATTLHAGSWLGVLETR